MSQKPVADVETLVVIVNYKSAPMTLEAVHSVFRGGTLGSLRVVVVDNSGTEEDAALLRQELPPRVRLDVCQENLGFGRACNRAIEGFDGDAVLLMNPDSRLLPGCLVRLQTTLFSDRSIGAVSPQIFWDDELSFCISPCFPPGLFAFLPLLDELGSQAGLSRILSRIWRRHAMRIWNSERPVTVSNLSGGLVLLKRSAVQRAGGLFDPCFFLYFEDTDLFIRLRKAGFGLCIEPRGKAIHYYDRCGQEDFPWKRACMAESLEIFLRKHHQTRTSRVLNIPGRVGFIRRRPGGFSGKRVFKAPFTLRVPASMRPGWVFEWSPNPNFIPSAGRFGEGAFMSFSERHWGQLAPGRYYGRLGKSTGFGTPFIEISWLVED